MSTRKIVIGIIVIVLFFAGSVYLSKRLSPDYAKVQAWNAAGIECLPSGHSNLGQHIHQKMTISVNGVVENLPADLGVAKNCLAELHTHDQAGDLNVIHLETVSATRQMTLGQFFTLWGESIERAGYSYTFKINGATSTEAVKDVVLQDGQFFEILYISSDGATSTTTSSLEL